MYLSVNLRCPMVVGNEMHNCSSHNSMPNVNGNYKSLPQASAGCPNATLEMNSYLNENTLPTSRPHSGVQSHMGGVAGVPGVAGMSSSSLHHQVCPQYPHHVDTRAQTLPYKDNVNAGMGHPHPAFPPVNFQNFPFLFNPSQYSSFSQLQQYFTRDKQLGFGQYGSNDHAAKAAFMDFARLGHYPLGKKLFSCPQCRYITDRKNNLKRHIATMHNECDKVLECCGVVFSNKASLRDHVLIFHSNGYMCRYCGRNFCRKALLKRHLTVHSGQKDYSCNMCDYATSHKSNLERHKKVHERQATDGQDDSDLNSSHDDLSFLDSQHQIDVTSVASDTPLIEPGRDSPVCHMEKATLPEIDKLLPLAGNLGHAN